MKKVILIALVGIILIASGIFFYNRLTLNEEVKEIDVDSWLREIEENPDIDISYEVIDGEEKAFIHQDNLIVNFEQVYSGLTEQHFLVTINQENTNEERNSDFDFDLTNLNSNIPNEDVKVYELVEVNEEINQCLTCSFTDSNGTSKPITDCEECGSIKNSRTYDKEVEIDEGSITISPSEEKRLLVKIKTKLTYNEDKGYNSQGILHLNIDNNQFEDLTHSSWWNGSCLKRTELNFTNPDAFDHTSEVLHYWLFNDTDWNTYKEAPNDVHIINSTDDIVITEIDQYNGTHDRVEWINTIPASSTETYYLYFDCTGVDADNATLFDRKDFFENGDTTYGGYNSSFWTPTVVNADPTNLSTDTTTVREGFSSMEMFSITSDVREYLTSASVNRGTVSWFQFVNDTNNAAAGMDFGGMKFRDRSDGECATDNYTVLDDSGFICSDLERTLGWHFIKIHSYGNGSGAYYVDNNLIATRTSFTTPSTILYGQLSSLSNAATYFDSFRYVDTSRLNLTYFEYPNPSYLAQNGSIEEYSSGAPEVYILSPTNNSVITLPYNITFNVTDPTGDDLNVTLYWNTTNNETIIVTDLTGNDNGYLTTSGQPIGLYDLKLTACETGTPLLECNTTFHNVSIQNNAPDAITVKLNATNNLNQTIENLTCSFTPLTIDGGETLTYDINWYNASDIIEFNYSNLAATNGTGIINTLDSGNTTQGDTWKCEARVFDQTNYTAWVNSSSLLIVTPSYVLGSTLTNNASTAETAYETFILNVSYADWLVDDINASFNYNGTLQTVTTLDETSNQTSFSATVAIPQVDNVETKNWRWNLTHYLYNGTTVTNNTYTGTQTVNKLVMQLCNGTFQQYLNFSFRNETTNGVMTGRFVSSTFYYYLGDHSLRRSFTTYTSSGNEANHSICIYPSTYPYYINISVSYDNQPSYLQRNYVNNSLYQNVTIDIPLYLLSSTDGIYTTFQVLNPSQSPLSDVLVTAEQQISGTFYLLESKYTDAAGGATFWVNPNNVHRFTFEKEGYDSTSQTITPTQSSYTVTLGTTISTPVNYRQGVSYSIAPEDITLNNNTDYIFSFNIGSSHFSMSEYGFVITNSSGSVLAITSGTTATGSNLSTLLNTGNNSKFTMNYYWVINSSYNNGTKEWSVYSQYQGDYSLLTFFEDLKAFGYSGFNDRTRILIAFVIIFLITASITYVSGQTSPIAILIEVTALTALFDFSGFLGQPFAIPYITTIALGLITVSYMFISWYRGLND